MSDDASLVRRAQAGDVAGLGELLERHRALLHAVAVGMLGHGPEAEDAVHDTFVIALRRIGDLRDAAAARAWLLAILGNVCRAQLRRVPVDPVADVSEPAIGARPVDEAIDLLALRDWVWTALDRLSPPLRTRSCCATSAARAPTTRSPSSAASRSAPSAAGSTPRAPSSPTRCSRRRPSATPGPRASSRSPPASR
jgi:hypothetical protein